METTKETLYLGLDVGSTTAKLTLATATGEVLEAQYQRHGAAVRQTLSAMLQQLAQKYPGVRVCAGITGSASLALAESLELPFVQEVMAASRSITFLAPQTDVAVELGGEDAKILYLSQGMDLRMNEACAGGTGAFIDQMATLLHTDAAGLNTLAAGHKRLYPIASRCGVFAKTDVVPLLNEGAAREDVAASIFQAVVEQTISGLACGNPIRGNVAFLGGPLHFLPELRKRFIETLKLKPDEAIVFPLGQYMVALGTALSLIPSEKAIRGAAVVPLARPLTIEELAARAASKNIHVAEITQSLPQLFADEADYAAFRKRHDRDRVPRRPLAQASGPLFLGVDLGSTTVKTVLTDEEGFVLDSSYARNQGDPLHELIPYLVNLLDNLPPDAHLRACATTGYGAQLAQAALNAAFSDVETVAHLKAACTLMPDATYVIDIGGQDMKCLKAEDGVIAGVTLNEACSAGCGAFLETFARSLNLSMEDFVQAALYAKHPVDLGSRCTVFMNSKVKQAQKEGAGIGDIAAGLCYSVAKNALYKVLRLRSTEELGPRVLVQGGSFMNDALLRVMERLLNREVFRPDIAGLMGAYGAALLARQRVDSAPENSLTAAELRALKITTRYTRCPGCGNHCRLTINRFSNGQRLVSGNRCERGALEGKRTGPEMPNLFAWKIKRLFGYEPLPIEEAPRGQIGIPRVLNMFEHYPFWFTFFTELGYRVELSPESSKELYDLGLDSMPSQTVCFPAKLAHGHVTSLIRKGIKHIFYPCLPRETRESTTAADCYSCPVVCSYPEVIRLNTDELKEAGCTFHSPFVMLNHDKSLVSILAKEFGLPEKEVARAVAAAHREEEAYRAELWAEGERVLEEVHKNGWLGIILSGRPYHADPLIHHGLPELIASLGAAVLSEDSVAQLKPNPGDLRVVDQWTYHSRLYRAAALACTLDDVELVQITSFGCGLDAITADQVSEKLRAHGKLPTLIKIDEGASLGAARIRIRSLLAAVQERRIKAEQARKAMLLAAEAAERQTAKAAKAADDRKNDRNSDRNDDSRKGGPRPPSSSDGGIYKPVFTKAMRQTYTILAPQMAPIHFEIMEKAINSVGYRMQLLPVATRADIEIGLNLVHNDACYPSLVVIGQLVRALQTGQSDPKHTAILMTQTCGPCRATNYIPLLRKALVEAGFPDVPVLSLSGGSLEEQPGFSFTRDMLRKMILGCLYGDMLQRLSLSCRAHERNAGDTQDLMDYWMNRVKFASARGDTGVFRGHMREMVRDFSAIRRDSVPRPKVGIVGEILLKYHPDANNHCAELILREGGEPVLTDLIDFILYCMNDALYRWKTFDGKASAALGNWGMIQWIEHLRNAMRKALAGTKFMPVSHLRELRLGVKDVISLGNQAGEGWLLTSEMLELIDHGAPNVLCLQPFGCLPNHITGKGVIKELKRIRPKANIMAVDYDPGSSETNQINRIKLFMSVAHSRMAEMVQKSTPRTPGAVVADLAGRLKDNLAETIADTGLRKEPKLV